MPKRVAAVGLMLFFAACLNTQGLSTRVDGGADSRSKDDAPRGDVGGAIVPQADAAADANVPTVDAAKDGKGTGGATAGAGGVLGGAGAAGTAGRGGTAGIAGTAGTTGTAGAGSAGTAGVAGTAGMAGTAGTGSAGMSGTAGFAGGTSGGSPGSGGIAGTAGAAGSAGTAGVAGAAGDTGTAGTGGVVGTGGGAGVAGGTAGMGGAAGGAGGTAETGGNAGAGGTAGTGGAGGTAGAGGTIAKSCKAGSCAADQFCQAVTGSCDTINSPGTCTTVPTADSCATSGPKVCGCNWKTYANDCLRKVDRVNKLSEGACTCGGPFALTCAAGTFCEYNTCALGAAGTCEVKPSAASCPDTNVPVCGCDGKTYRNDCLRQAAGVAKRSNTACGPGPY